MASESVVHKPGSKEFVLPYGFIQSPLLASLALDKSRLGRLLHKISCTKTLKVSVYVDDIIISSRHKSEIIELIPTLEEVSKNARFSLNADKTQGPSELITVFNIELSRNRVQLSPDRLKKFQEVIANTTNLAVEAAIVSYIQSVNFRQRN